MKSSKTILAILTIAAVSAFSIKVQAVEEEGIATQTVAKTPQEAVQELAVRIMRAVNQRVQRSCSDSERVKAYAWLAKGYSGQILEYARVLWDHGVIDVNAVYWSPRLITVFYQIYSEEGERNLAVIEALLKERRGTVPVSEQRICEPLKVEVAPVEVQVAPIEVKVDLTPQPVKVEVTMAPQQPVIQPIYLQPVDTRIPLAFTQGQPNRTRNERTLLSFGQTGVSNIKVSNFATAPTTVTAAGGNVGDINVSAEAEAAAAASAAATAEAN